MALTAAVMPTKKPLRALPYGGIANSMLGNTPAFQSPTDLPNNYGFNDLAGYEEKRRNALGGQFQNQINEARTGIESSYNNALKGYQDTTAKRRSDLASSLSSSGQQNFQLQNPKILEDLNSRGVFSSPTAVAQAQAQALKEIELANQDKLNAFDTQSRGYEDTLNSQKLQELNQLGLAGTSANIQSQQDALDAGLDLRRGGLESQLQTANAAREEAMARDLAADSRKAGITNSLIGVGGSLLGSGLGKDGFLSGLFSKKAPETIGTTLAGTTAAGAIPTAGGTAATAGAGAAGAGGAGAGIGGALLPVAGAAGGLAAYEGIRKSLVGQGVNKDVAKGLGAIPGVGIQVGLANKALSKAGFGAGKTGANIGNNQAQMNELFNGTKELKQALDSGQIDQQTHDAYAEQLANQALVLLNRTASIDSKAANNIRPNFNQFVTSGLIKKVGNDNYATTLGNQYDVTAALKAAGII